MKVRIEGRYGRYADATDMYRLLGVKRLPPEGMDIREIQGVRVYVKPLPRDMPTSHSYRIARRCGHRVMAICNCGQHVPVGRLHQHKCEGKTGHKHSKGDTE